MVFIYKIRWNSEPRVRKTLLNVDVIVLRSHYPFHPCYTGGTMERWKLPHRIEFANMPSSPEGLYSSRGRKRCPGYLAGRETSLLTTYLLKTFISDVRVKKDLDSNAILRARRVGSTIFTCCVKSILFISLNSPDYSLLFKSLF